MHHGFLRPSSSGVPTERGHSRRARRHVYCRVPQDARFKSVAPAGNIPCATKARQTRPERGNVESERITSQLTTAQWKGGPDATTVRSSRTAIANGPTDSTHYAAPLAVAE